MTRTGLLRALIASTALAMIDSQTPDRLSPEERARRRAKNKRRWQERQRARARKR